MQNQFPFGKEKAPLKFDTQIKTTTDYSKFKTLKGNRSLSIYFLQSW